jgi:8-oxo-dGTP pyrophosphatase MutT (NUDIX family)
VRFCGTGDPELAHSDDPRRSRTRLEQARWTDVGRDRERARVLELLGEHGAALALRDTEPGHLTGSALVVDHAGERVLVMFHRKLQRWLQPGGHADGDHELAGVAWREATEETGIEGLVVLLPAVDIDVHEIPARGDQPAHLHLDLRFVVVAPPDAVVQGNDESEALRWLSLDELRELSDEPGLVRLAERGLRAYRAALGAVGDPFS